MKTVAEYQQEQRTHVIRTGGYDAPREADDTYNDLNRAQIAAYRAEHGAAYVGRINHYGTERQHIISGEQSPIEEYAGDTVYNWGCDFCIPAYDAELANMIRRWNSPNAALEAGAMKTIAAITNRVEQLGGIQFLWY